MKSTSVKEISWAAVSAGEWEGSNVDRRRTDLCVRHKIIVCYLSTFGESLSLTRARLFPLFMALHPCFVVTLLAPCIQILYIYFALPSLFLQTSHRPYRPRPFSENKTRAFSIDAIRHREV
jgi:hypothetical protein